MALNIKNIIKESISDYLNELNTEKENQEEASSGYMGYTEKALTEGEADFEDKVTKDGNIYLIKKPTKDMSEGGIVEEVSFKSLIGEGYVGAYLAGPQALTAGKKALKARDSKLKETIGVGKSKVTELEAKIEELKHQIEDNSTRAVHDPQRRGELTETNDSLFAQLEKIENAVEKLKAALEKESPKKAKKEKKEDVNEGAINSDYKYIYKKIVQKHPDLVGGTHNWNLIKSFVDDEIDNIEITDTQDILNKFQEYRKKKFKEFLNKTLGREKNEK